jgi:hypothetical protein
MYIIMEFNNICTHFQYKIPARRRGRNEHIKVLDLESILEVQTMQLRTLQ